MRIFRLANGAHLDLEHVSVIQAPTLELHSFNYFPFTVIRFILLFRETPINQAFEFHHFGVSREVLPLREDDGVDRMELVHRYKNTLNEELMNLTSVEYTRIVDEWKKGKSSDACPQLVR